MTRLCRRICLLRATGEAVEAARLHDTELPSVLGRCDGDPADPDTARQLAAVFAAEEQRVTDAALLAELLAPLLAQRLHTPAPLATAGRPAAASTSSTASDSPPTRRPISPSAPDIADFIDEMLNHERATARSGTRRAS